MEYLTERNWRPLKGQYEIGEKVKVKIWVCGDRMRCRGDSCRIEDVNLSEAKGFAVQIATPKRQSKRSIPKAKMDMIGLSPKDMAEYLVEDAVSE